MTHREWRFHFPADIQLIWMPIESSESRRARR